MFPHHENEIAQSRCGTDGEFARVWLHCSHLIVDGTKMSKSIGNVVTLEQLIANGHDPVSIRFLLSSVHYRRQLNFTADALDQAEASVRRLRDFLLRVESALPGLPRQSDRSGALAEALAAARSGFSSAIDDDLNTSGALGHLFSLVREANTALDRGHADVHTVESIVAWVRDVDSIWAVLPVSTLRELTVSHGDRRLVLIGPEVEKGILERIVDRARARADRDFATADRLRDELQAEGIEVEDTPAGARWKKV
jgi:cysteinyl-tRNA synthetase